MRLDAHAPGRSARRRSEGPKVNVWRRAGSPRALALQVVAETADLLGRTRAVSRVTHQLPELAREHCLPKRRFAKRKRASRRPSILQANLTIRRRLVVGGGGAAREWFQPRRACADADGGDDRPPCDPPHLLSAPGHHLDISRSPTFATVPRHSRLARWRASITRSSNRARAAAGCGEIAALTTGSPLVERPHSPRWR